MKELEILLCLSFYLLSIYRCPIHMNNGVTVCNKHGTRLGHISAIYLYCGVFQVMNLYGVSRLTFQMFLKLDVSWKQDRRLLRGMQLRVLDSAMGVSVCTLFIKLKVPFNGLVSNMFVTKPLITRVKWCRIILLWIPQQAFKLRNSILSLP
jgi:hypothetical protein